MLETREQSRKQLRLYADMLKARTDYNEAVEFERQAPAGFVECAMVLVALRKGNMKAAQRAWDATFEAGMAPKGGG